MRLEELRSDFPILTKVINEYPLVYLDNAATTQKPLCVIEAISSFYSKEYGTVHRAAYTLAREASDRYFRVRQQVQKWIGAERVEEVIFTRGTTDSLNLVASSFGDSLQEGDEVIISQLEHHSNLVPWQLLAERKGIKLRYIPLMPTGDLDQKSFEGYLNKRTKLVAFAHIANSTGTINPIAEWTKLAHEVGAKVCIDGAQAVGHRRIDVRSLDADFYAFSGHKMYGPTGIGVLYGKYHLLEEMRPYQGGGDMIDSVSLEKTTFAPPPLRFEAGTPMIAEVIGLGVTIEYLERVGMSWIEDHEKELTHYAFEKMASIPSIRFMGTPKERAAIISFTMGGAHSLDVTTFLDVKGIAIRSGHLCAQPALRYFGYSSVMRASFGIYNTKEEVDHFVDALCNALVFSCNE